MKLKTLIFSKTKHDMCCKSCSCLVVLWKLCKLCSSWVSGCFALMKRSEIVVLVQVAREIVFKQDTALHRVIAVLCAYIVDCFSSLSALSFGSSKRLICTPSLFSSLIADTVIARRGSLKLCIFSIRLIADFAIAPEFALAGESGICFDVHCKAGFLIESPMPFATRL